MGTGVPHAMHSMKTMPIGSSNDGKTPTDAAPYSLASTCQIRQVGIPGQIPRTDGRAPATYAISVNLGAISTLISARTRSRRDLDVDPGGIPACRLRLRAHKVRILEAKVLG